MRSVSTCTLIGLIVGMIAQMIMSIGKMLKGKTMRLIDADAMLETLKRKYPQWFTEKPKDSWMHYAWSVYYWAVREAPTIDAVPVEVVADMFGEVPCNYAFCAIQGDDYIQVDDFMYEHCDGWCEDKCGEVPMIECWRRFFKAWVERRDDETN